jgi:hypothetical protein
MQSDESSRASNMYSKQWSGRGANTIRLASTESFLDPCRTSCYLNLLGTKTKPNQTKPNQPRHLPLDSFPVTHGTETKEAKSQIPPESRRETAEDSKTRDTGGALSRSREHLAHCQTARRARWNRER